MATSLAALLFAAACRGDRAGADARAAGDSAAPASTGASAPDGGDAAAAPGPVQIWTPQDSARAAREDSIDLANDYNQRRAGMETYQSCMAKAKGLEPGPRAIIEQACARSHPGGR